MPAEQPSPPVRVHGPTRCAGGKRFFDFQHGESAENTVFTERTLCCWRNLRGIHFGLPLNFNAPRLVDGLRRYVV